MFSWKIVFIIIYFKDVKLFEAKRKCMQYKKFLTEHTYVSDFTYFFLVVIIYFDPFPFWRESRIVADRRDHSPVEFLFVSLISFLHRRWCATTNRSESVFSTRVPDIPRTWPLAKKILISRGSTGITGMKSNARGRGKGRLFESLLWKPSTEWNCTTRAVAISNSGIEHGTWLSALPGQLLTPTVGCVRPSLLRTRNSPATHVVRIYNTRK